MNYLHRAWAEINLDALLHNFNTIKSSTDAKIFSVVKANAYGHSVGKIALLLDKAGTDFFAVSNIDEAEELRQLGTQKPILILGYTPATFAEKLIKLNLWQTVFSLEYALSLDQNAKELGATIPCHLKFDTGMGRLGFDLRKGLDGLDDVRSALNLPSLKFEGVFTHFPVADSYKKADKAFTDEQYGKDEQYDYATGIYGYLHRAKEGVVQHEIDSCCSEKNEQQQGGRTHDVARCHSKECRDYHDDGKTCENYHVYSHNFWNCLVVSPYGLSVQLDYELAAVEYRILELVAELYRSLGTRIDA